MLGTMASNTILNRTANLVFVLIFVNSPFKYIECFQDLHTALVVLGLNPMEQVEIKQII